MTMKIFVNGKESEASTIKAARRRKQRLLEFEFKDQ
jgi:hypothetical protein